MRFSSIPLLLLAASSSTLALPATNKRQLSSISLLDRVLLFDGFAFPDPSNAGNTLLQMQTYVSLRTPDLGAATAVVTNLLSGLGVPVGEALNTLQERLEVLGSIGLPGKKVEASVTGCANTAKLPGTNARDLGLANGIANLGQCSGQRELEATVKTGLFDNRNIKSQVFFSPDEGFGVISDIDDTIKISNVLDTASLLKSTLLEAPKFVPGMPDLYASLASTLPTPQFVYITATPYQFYPFLNSFIDSSFSASKGPIFTQNLTVVDIPELINFVTDAGSDPLAYKLSMIDRVQAMYPKKKWVVIGDSTQKDPEVYAAAFRKFGGDFIQCIWIRQVDGADNAAQRFTTAFEGVPQERFRVFSDNEIASLAQRDVVNGQC